MKWYNTDKGFGFIGRDQGGRDIFVHASAFESRDWWRASAIVETVAKIDAAEAFDLLWRLMALAPTVFARCDDSSGTMIGVFRQACRDLGGIASSANADPRVLADRAYEALLVNDYGQFDELIRVLAPALGKTGLEHLKRRMIDLSSGSEPHRTRPPLWSR